MGDYRRLRVTLGNSQGDATTLKYQIRDTQAAQLWASSIVTAQGAGLRERNRFHNFPGHADASLAHLIARVESIAGDLADLHPELEFPRLDRANLQASVSKLHKNFAHSHLVTQMIRPGTAQLWSDFNLALHAIEGYLLEQVIVGESGGLHGATVIFTWNDPCKVPIPQASYADFCLQYDFGAAYLNYSEVGRHIYEIYQAGDDALDDTHIRPHRHISANTFLWFGPSTGHFWAAKTRAKIATWFAERKDRFTRLGLEWDDPRLALGKIPVAQLETPLYTPNEIATYVRELSRFDRVESVEVL